MKKKINKLASVMWQWVAIVLAMLIGFVCLIVDQRRRVEEKIAELNATKSKSYDNVERTVAKPIHNFSPNNDAEHVNLLATQVSMYGPRASAYWSSEDDVVLADNFADAYGVPTGFDTKTQWED